MKVFVHLKKKRKKREEDSEPKSLFIAIHSYVYKK